MLPSFLRLPVSIALCGASLCSAAVLLLQNVPACARWAEEHGLASCTHVQDSFRLLQDASESVYLPTLNQAELSLADSASSLLEPPIGEVDPLSLLHLLPDALLDDPSKDELCCVPCVEEPSSAPHSLPTEPSVEHDSNRDVCSAQQPEVDSTDGGATSEPEVCATDGDAKPKPEVCAADGDAKPEPEVCATDGDAKPEPEVCATDGDAKPKPEACATDGDAKPEPEVCVTDGDAKPKPEACATDGDAKPEPEACAADGGAKPEPEACAADGDAKSKSEPACEGGSGYGHACFSGIFSPSPFLSVSPKFSLLSLPRLSLSVDALRWSVIDVRAAAPRGTSAKPPEIAASKPEVGNNREQTEGSTAAADAKSDAPPAAQATLAEGETTPPMRCRILMVGDSLMEALGPMTHRAMSHRMGLEFIISARYSTGLCRPDYFDWPEHLSDVVRRHKPDLAIFFIGANDGMPVLEGKRNVPLGGEAWRVAYAAKMAMMVDIVRQAGADIIWVELPSASPKFNKHLGDTRQVQHSFCESHGVPIFHTDLIFSGEEGRFEAYGDFHGTLTRLRKKDLVHLTEQGNQKLLEHLLPLLEQHLFAFYTTHPERHLSQEEVSKIHRVPAVFTCHAYHLRPKKRTKRAPTSLPH